ncbi:hypothetical protein [Pseudodesulfovibrio indicus]|uniref:hypothetical protein n=1 Tax=Pseudodesulfovibrio indicus TaxID=1716143 RepID=UPI002930B948|nr:hypothetical protein [Pseudodesulfovibrio indicus]
MTDREKTALWSAIGNFLLGLLFVPWGLDIVETGVVGKYDDFPAFEFSGWAFVGAGVIFMTFGLYRFLKCLLTRKQGTARTAGSGTDNPVRDAGGEGTSGSRDLPPAGR